MKKLNKEQQTLLEHALDNLYDYLKNMYKVDYDGKIVGAVYDDVIHLYQCAFPEGIAWFADIVLKDRRIYISVREAEDDHINSEFDYYLIYMRSKPTIHTICF